VPWSAEICDLLWPSNWKWNAWQLTSAAGSAIFMHFIYLNPGSLGRSTQLTSAFYELEVGFAPWQHKLNRMHLFDQSFFGVFFLFIRRGGGGLECGKCKLPCRNKEQLQRNQPAGKSKESGEKLKDAAVQVQPKRKIGKVTG